MSTLKLKCVVIAVVAQAIVVRLSDKLKVFDTSTFEMRGVRCEFRKNLHTVYYIYMKFLFCNLAIYLI